MAQRATSLDHSWKRASDWEGSPWSVPTKWTLKGSDYDTDREWHLRNMKYGEGWAYDPLDATTKQQSLQVQNLKMIERQSPHCPLVLRQRRMIRKVITPCGRERITASTGGTEPHQESNGSPDYDMTEIYPVWQEILQRPALLPTASTVYMKVKETQ